MGGDRQTDRHRQRQTDTDRDRKTKREREKGGGGGVVVGNEVRRLMELERSSLSHRCLR